MKKVKKKNSYKNMLVPFIVGLVLLLFFLIYFLGRMFHPFYEIDSRVSRLEEKKEVYDEKVVSWVKVQGTNIDYPVIYNGEDVQLDELKYDFAWINESSEKLGNREVVFGHNILNVSTTPLVTDPSHTRFEQLLSFIYIDFAKDNQYIQYTKDGKDYLYEIFAVSFIDDEKLDYYELNYNKEDLSNYINDARKSSFYDYHVEVNADDDILSLITCTRFYGFDANVDFKIDARKVRKNEVVKKYKVAESGKYDKIKEEMKGDEADGKV